MGERFNDGARGDMDWLAHRLTWAERRKYRAECHRDLFVKPWVCVVEVLGDVAHVYVRRRGGDLLFILEVDNQTKGESEDVRT